MAYVLAFTKEFYESLGALDNSIRLRLPKIFEKLKQNPQSGKPLHGKYGYHRLRFLNYRLTYLIKENEKKVLLLEIGKRDDIYK